MSARRWLPVATATLVYWVLSADSAAAWGPACHVMLANDLLSQLAILPASLAALLTRHCTDFIYGNLAADVVFAKRLSPVKQFCHQWGTGFTLLGDADTDRKRAFALGYLSHLAADTVAHNKFLPYQMMTTRTTVSLGHPYWELRAEQVVDEPHWRQLYRLMRRRFPVHERAMALRLDQALLPFHVNRRLFYTVNRVSSNRTWRLGTRVWRQLSRYALPEDLLPDYWAECLERMVSVVIDGHRSPVLREDPNGTSTLLRVKESRKHLRRMARSAVLTIPVLEEALAPYRPSPTTKTALAV